MGKKNVGGRARKVELTLAEWSDTLDRAEARGFEMGLEAAERLSRLPANDCPMCALSRKLEAAEDRLRVLDFSDRRKPGRY